MSPWLVARVGELVYTRWEEIGPSFALLQKGSQAMSPLSFAQAIRPLFRDEDVEEMKYQSDFDLSKYEDVRARAADIYGLAGRANRQAQAVDGRGNGSIGRSPASDGPGARRGRDKMSCAVTCGDGPTYKSLSTA
jgi:hypothetical protein